MAETRKKRMVPVGEHVTFDDAGGGRTRATFAPLGISAEGGDEEEAREQLMTTLSAAIQTDEHKEAWTAWAEAHAVEVEDEPLAPEVEAALHALVELDPEEFDTFLVEAEHPVLVDFWAPWCQPCLMMAPELVKVAEQLEGRLVLRKVNVDNAPKLSQRFEIRGIPCMILFKGSEEAHRVIGAQPAADVIAELEPHLG